MHGLRTVGISTFTLLVLATGCQGAASSSAQDGASGDDAATSVPAKDAQPRDRSGDTPPVGVTWSLADSGTDKDLYVVLWAGNRFVAVGDGGTVLSSADGSTWTRLETGISDNLRSLTWTGSRLVAVSQDGKILTSENGTSWTERGVNLNKLMRQVAWTGKLLSAVGGQVTTAVSSDGITWTTRQNTDLYTFVPTSAVWTGNG